jgi:hypothetical protein
VCQPERTARRPRLRPRRCPPTVSTTPSGSEGWSSSPTPEPTGPSPCPVRPGGFPTAGRLYASLAHPRSARCDRTSNALTLVTWACCLDQGTCPGRAFQTLTQSWQRARIDTVANRGNTVHPPPMSHSPHCPVQPDRPSDPKQEGIQPTGCPWVRGPGSRYEPPGEIGVLGHPDHQAGPGRGEPRPPGRLRSLMAIATRQHPTIPGTVHLWVFTTTTFLPLFEW